MHTKTIYLLTAMLSWLLVSACSQPDAPTKSSTPVDYQPKGVIAGTLPEIVTALETGLITSEQLVQAYLERIAQVDKNGPNLQSVLSINPDAISRAIELDILRNEGKIQGKLHGVPILLKDNIETKDNLATTAGALALKDNITGRDSPLVAGLRAQGAIILGKTNLSQWANFRSLDSMSGWSALGGQVRNPHILSRNPCGSSSGSGAATAASLAAGTVGTETNGSVICPSNVNGIVGFKPTVGIVPQAGIIPISHSQDTAGPMTKSVMGAAMMMNAMATTTPETDYTAKLDVSALGGVRVGVLRFAIGGNDNIRNQFDASLKDLEAAGAVLVEITERPATPDGFGRMAYDILKFEFKDGLNNYLASTDPARVPTRTLAEVIEFNNANAEVELGLFDQSILDASQEMATLESEDYTTAIATVQKATREDGIDFIMAQHDVKVLVAPSGVLASRIDPVNGDVWPGGWPGYGSHAARAGYPHATVPMGAYRNMPIGMSFIGTANQDAEILSFAFAYEQQSQKRVTPNYLASAEDDETIGRLMKPYQPKQ